MQDSPWTPLLFVLFFVGMWLFVTFVIGYTSGWASLARIYRAVRPFEGARVRVRGAQMGRTMMSGTFRNVLTVGVNAEGIQLSVLVLFRISSPDLFIPWSDIAVSRGKWWFMDYVELRFNRAPDIPLRIFGAARDTIPAAAGVAWPRETPRDVAQR